MLVLALNTFSVAAISLLRQQEDDFPRLCDHQPERLRTEAGISRLKQLLRGESVSWDAAESVEPQTLGRSPQLLVRRLQRGVMPQAI
jgi:hypothetical protein